MSELIQDWRGLTLLTPPSVEPVLVATAKAHTRVETSVDDAYMATLISTARDYVERYTRRALMHQRWELVLDTFPQGSIRLPVPPLALVESGITAGQPVGVEVSYLLDDETVVMASSDYRVLRVSEETYLVRRDAWPDVDETIGAVSIKFWAGYTGLEGDRENKVPNPLKQSILMLCGHFYTNREAITQSNVIVSNVPFAVDDLLGPYRAVGF